MEQKWRGARTTDVAPALLEGIDSLRDELRKHTGISVPGVRFRVLRSEAGGLAPRQFRIEVLNQSSNSAETQPINVSSEDGLSEFINTLEARIWRFRAYWINAEAAQSALWYLSSHRPELHQWIEDRYSITDVKLLLRAVINSDLEKPGLTEKLDLIHEAKGGPSKAPPENTIRHTDWLLGSLVFWAAVGNDLRDLKGIAGRLRQTQLARLRPSEVTASPSDNGPVVAGIGALTKGQIQEAVALFRQAAQGDPSEAIRIFLAHYPSQLGPQIRQSLEQSCSDLDKVSLEGEQLLNLADMIEATAEVVPRDLRRRFELCLLARYDPAKRPQLRSSLVRSLLIEPLKPDEWDAEEAAYLGTLLVKEYDPLSSSDSDLVAAQQLLGSALRRLGDQQSETVFQKITEVCEADGAKAWCWKLADDLAKVSHNSHVLTALAFALSGLEDRRYLRRALEAVKVAEEDRSSADLSAEKKEWWSSILAYSHAVANIRLAALGEPHEDPESMLRKVIASLDSPLLKKYSADFQPVVYNRLINFLNDEGRSSEAIDLAKSALVRWPGDPDLLASKLWIEIADENWTGVTVTASSLAEKASGNEKILFNAAVGELLSGKNTGSHALTREFLETKHPYVRYVALLLMAFESGKDNQGDAKWRLVHLWDAADRKRWEVRLRHGDPNVWREMLTGYALGYMTRNQLYEPLINEATFEASPFSNLSLSLQGMRCEFHFYDALVAKLKGDRTRMLHELQAAIDTQYRQYLEYKLAKFLFKHQAKIWD